MSEVIEELKCSFCGRPSSEVEKIFEGLHGNICKDCAEEVVSDVSFDYENAIEKVKDLKKPFQIVKELDKHIIGQDNAKKMLAVAAYNHYKRVMFDGKLEKIKSNILLLGPTGSGKTYLIEKLGEILDVPFAISDATALTETGYVGEDVESVVGRLLKATNMDVEKAERGIIYIDEIDKIAVRSVEDRSGSRDVSGEGVQQGLLRIMEGATIEVQVGNKRSDKVKVNTKNILFVCSGAFVGIEKVVERRSKTNVALGFSNESKISGEYANKSKNIDIQDLIKYGMISEFLGRLPVIVELKKLEIEDLKRVFREPKSSLLSQYIELFRMEGIELDFEEDAIDYIVKKAYDRGTGARGLKGIVDPYMSNLMYDVTEKGIEGEYLITKQCLIEYEK